MSLAKFTICLPSHGRLPNLVSTLTSLTSISARDDVEIIVTLNNYPPHIEEKLRRQFDAGNYIFCSTPELYDMPTNFEYALSMSTGEYITFIGNDDALTPGAIDTASEHFQMHPKSVLAWYRWPYYWNSYQPLASRLFIHRKTKSSYVSTTQAIEDLLYRYADFSILPCVYNSFFPRHIIDLIRKYPYHNGSLKGWPRLWPENRVLSLDVFNSFQSLAFIDHYYFSPYPLSLSGISGLGGGMTYNPFDMKNISFADARIAVSGSQSVILATDLLTVSELYYCSHPLLSTLSIDAIRRGAYFRYLAMEKDQYPELLGDFEKIARELNEPTSKNIDLPQKANIMPILPRILMPDLNHNLKVVDALEYGVKTCGDAAEIYPYLADKLFASE